MKSDAVRRPAKVDVWVFHSGAETMSEISCIWGETILDETIQGFLDEEVCVEED
jgi:hypothetical protein